MEHSYPERIISYKTEQDSYLIHKYFLLTFVGGWFQKLTFQNFSYIHIYASVFYVDLMTPESQWRHKAVAMHVTHKAMDRFPTMHDSPSPALELRLQI